jgi:RNA 2',3'-cyclic 3'-phosphodiesterase
VRDGRGPFAADGRGGPSEPRLFIAVPLPDEAVEDVGAIVGSVRAQPLPAGARDVRWVRLDGLHLTMRFLGPTEETRVPAAIEAVEAAAASTDGPIELELAGTGTFPAGGRPRALWIGVETATDQLERLATTTDAELERRGWARTDRPFRAHLTLARSDGVAAGRLVAERLVAVVAERRIPVRVDRIGLFESVTGGGPARYLPVAIRNLA